MGPGRPLTAVAITAALMAACGGESSQKRNDNGSGDEPEGPKTSVVATAPDGEKVEFTDFSVTCRSSAGEEPPAQLVIAMAGLGDAERPRKPRGPAMIIEAADAAGGTTVQLPHNEQVGKEKTFISVFITEVEDELEIASNTELSTGDIEVVSASCDPTPLLEIRIDGVMESELSGNTVTVEGYVAVERRLRRSMHARNEAIFAVEIQGSRRFGVGDSY